MNRKEIINLVNNKIAPQVGLDFTFSPMETVKMIEQWRRKNNFPVAMIPDVMNGFLFINDVPVGRIARTVQRVSFSEGALYWEGRILARQEAIYAD